MLPVITHPVTGRTFKLGRKRPIARGPRFRLRNYLKLSLPSPPLQTDYAKNSLSVLENIYGNDVEGDCVIAGMGHIAANLTGNATSGTSPLVLSLEQINKLYSAIGGYDPSQTDAQGNNPTDNGCNEVDALNYWQNNGLLPGEVAEHKIAGWMAVNALDPNEVRIALWLFENLMFGIELPDAWVSNIPSKSGFIWDVAGDADSDNGHCVVGVDYNAQGVVIDSWGMTGLLTNAAIAKYCVQQNGGELYTVLSLDAISKATSKAPSGFDWSQLVADFDSMSGGIKTNA